MREHKHPDYTWKVFDHLGHNLASEQAGEVEYGDQGKIADSRTGPIDPRVVEEIVQWVAKRAK